MRKEEIKNAEKEEVRFSMKIENNGKKVKREKNFVNLGTLKMYKVFGGGNFEIKSLGIVREDDVWYEKLDINGQVYWYVLLRIKEVDELGLGDRKGSKNCKEFGRLYMDYKGQENSLCFKYAITGKVLYYCFTHASKRLRNGKDVGILYIMEQYPKKCAYNNFLVFAKNLVKDRSRELHSVVG